MRKPEFDAVMDGLVSADGPGTAVAVRHRGEVVHSAGYGLANLEWGVPVDTETVFRIGSITKQFTAAAILRLAADGKLGLDDPIERHVPAFPVGDRRISLRQLLNHTAGVRSLTAMPQFVAIMRNDLPLTGLIALLEDQPPDFAPGERFLYSNSGYVLLGAVIEAASGRSYEAYLIETFFEPLGLARTSYLHNDPIVRKRASGYTLAPTLRNAAPISMTLPHAAGALGSTAEDLLAWELALRTGRAVSTDAYSAMTARGQLNDGAPIDYGLGLVNYTYRGHRLVGHGGGINGFVSNLVHWPDHDLTIAVAANSDAFPVQQATYALARQVLGEPDMVREAMSVSEAVLASCVGVYEFELGQRLRTKVKDGALTAHFPRVGSVFRPFGERAFFLASDPEVTFTFEDLRDGVCQRLVISGYGEPVTWTRAPAAP
ncbi:MAG TPA: serine hydrolase domain-containing protein [Caulobacteraceae bacterium]|jgi:CubicO group peptidase (beta-lactamase class C family)|nr:serine hydrolase domain-containing protein [Caulobacteraceae bacterium]